MAAWRAGFVLRLGAIFPGLLARARRQIAFGKPRPMAASNRPNPSQLLVDVSIICRNDAGSGIQRVVRELLRGLLAAAPAGWVIRPVWASRTRDYCYADRYLARIQGLAETTQSDDVSVQVAPGDCFLGLDLSSRIIPRRQVQLLAWKQQGVELWFVVYDLLPLHYPAWFTRKGQQVFPLWLRCLALHADALFCISKTVQAELQQWLKEAGNISGAELPVDWFHLGANWLPQAVGGETAAQTMRFAEQGCQILMVGTLEPRKGHAQVLDAFEVLWASGNTACLVLIGKEGWHCAELAARIRQHHLLGKQLYWLENIDDQQLLASYQACDGVIMASQAEGFGLPVIEAAQSGKPLLLRDIPVFREIAGEHASYFQADHPQALVDALRQWLAAVASKQAVGSQGLPWLSWQESTQQLLALLDKYRH